MPGWGQNAQEAMAVPIKAPVLSKDLKADLDIANTISSCQSDNLYKVLSDNISEKSLCVLRPRKAPLDLGLKRRHLIPPSSSEQLVVGLNLLRLLVQNRGADFHTELELLTPEVHLTPEPLHGLKS